MELWNKFWKWIYCGIITALKPHQCNLHSHDLCDHDTCIGNVQKECEHCTRPVPDDEDSPYYSKRS